MLARRPRKIWLDDIGCRWTRSRTRANAVDDTISSGWTTAFETSVVKEATPVQEARSRNDAEDKQAKSIAQRERNEQAESRSPPNPRRVCKSRSDYSPPVYLGRPAPHSYTYTYVPSMSSGFPIRLVSNSGPRRAFRAQEMWENQRRNGM